MSTTHKLHTQPPQVLTPHQVLLGQLTTYKRIRCDIQTNMLCVGSLAYYKAPFDINRNAPKVVKK